MLELIIKHPSFDKVKSHIQKAYFLAVKDNEEIILKKLLEVEGNDVNICCYSESILSCAMRHKSKDIITLILNYPSFNSEKSDILDSFIKCVLQISDYGEDDLLDILNDLYDYDQKHLHLINLNSLLSNGCTFFTMEHSCEGKYANFLLERGADPNIPDKNGIYPLEHAIINDCQDYALALINSNKIDYSIRIPNKPILPKFFNINSKKKPFNFTEAKYKTYLHLAARHNNCTILNSFIDKKLIDINVKDDFGETLLMEACRFSSSTAIRKLSEIDDLDYLHCNNNGENALQIIQGPINKSFNQITNKDDFFKEIFNSIINNKYQTIDDSSDFYRSYESNRYNFVYNDDNHDTSSDNNRNDFDSDSDDIIYDDDDY